MDYEPDPDDEPVETVRRPDTTPSDRGAGTVGFTGAANAPKSEATGLVELEGDPFGAGAAEPLLPSDWDSRGDSRH
jgi:hypothetical protein